MRHLLARGQRTAAVLVAVVPLVGVVLAAAGVAAAAAPAPGPPLSASPGHIALVRSVEGGSDIWRIDPDCSHPLRLTTSHHASAPAWSSAGDRIAYVDRDGIWIMHGDGSGKHLAVRSDDVLPTSRPAWSPDDTQLVFAGRSALYAVTFGKGKPRRIAQGTDPAWSPDGKRIAYIDTQLGAGARIWVAAADGHDPVAITAVGTVPQHLSWKAGPVIAFTFAEDGLHHLGVITDDGKSTESIAEGATGVTLSPDATKFVLAASTKDGQGILSVVNKGRVTLLGPGRQPDWGS